MGWLGALGPAVFAVLLVGSGCFPDFDMDGRDGCRTTGDCLSGRVCIRPAGEPGRCVPRAAAEGTGLPSAPGEAVSAGSTAAVSAGGADQETSGGGGGAPTDDTVGLPPASGAGGGSDNGSACAGFASERFLTDDANCGECGRVCSAPSARTACVEGRCTVIACARGFADVNGDPADGCERPCDDGGVYCRDHVGDRCGSPAGAQWAGCSDTAPLRGRRYAAWIWDAAPAWGEVQVGRLQVTGDGMEAELSELVRGNVLAPGRGGAVPTARYAVRRETGRTIVLEPAVSGGARIVLRAAESMGNRLLVGVEEDGGQPTGRLLVLLDNTASTSRGAWLPPHRVLLLSPANESEPAQGGAERLGWSNAAQLPIFEFGETEYGSERPLRVPMIEYRDRVLRAGGAGGTVVSLRWRLTPDGTVRVLRPSGNSLGPQYDKVIEGVATLDGGFAFAVARWNEGACPGGMNQVAGRCVPDPVLMLSVAQDVPPVVDLDGPWALTGVVWAPRSVGGGTLTLAQELLDFEIRVEDGVVVGPEVVGRLSVVEDPASRAPVLRLALEGNGASVLGRAGLVLEGHIAAENRVGLFWDRTPAPGAERPIGGGFVILQRQPRTPATLVD